MKRLQLYESNNNNNYVKKHCMCICNKINNSNVSNVPFFNNYKNYDNTLTKLLNVTFS